jgi:hypothetical protein
LYGKSSNSTPKNVKSTNEVKILKLAAKILLPLAAIYCAVLIGLYVIISLPPGRFANIIARIPSSTTPGGPLFQYILPLEPIFKSARAGKLRVGDPAPGFDLKLVHSSANDAQRVQLDSFRGVKPVVLIFGSYT